MRAASCARSFSGIRDCRSPSPPPTSSAGRPPSCPAAAHHVRRDGGRAALRARSSSSARCRTARRSSWVERARAAGAKVVDLSADLRIGNGWRATVPYGLTEAQRETIRGADLVANPGCYPTAILLGLLRSLERGSSRQGATIGVNAASGVTGAGFSARTDLLFAEVTENFRAYGVGNTHRHLSEMRAMLARNWRGRGPALHAAPAAGGARDSRDDDRTLSRAARESARAVARALRGRAVHRTRWSATRLRDVVHRNVVRIAARPVAHVRTPTLLVISAIDNLMKGAAGQAMQNANLDARARRDHGAPLRDARREDRRARAGGSAARSRARAAAHARREPAAPLCIVHGGGDEVSALQRRLGLEPAFSRRSPRHEGGGSRARPHGAVRHHQQATGRACCCRTAFAPSGISGEDACLFRARAMDRGDDGAGGRRR